MTIERIKSLHEYADKWIFRSGDLHAELVKDDDEITYLTCRAYEKYGLLFNTREEVEEARKKALSAIGIIAP